jgi:hypothetical protein
VTDLSGLALRFATATALLMRLNRFGIFRPIDETRGATALADIEGKSFGAAGASRSAAWRAIPIKSTPHLRRVLKSYARYYNEMRTHRSLDKDAPISRPVQRTSSIISHALSADCITTTSESEFSAHTPGQANEMALS